MNSTEPIAVTTGYYGGQPTVKTLDKSLVLPVGLALYTHPQPTQGVPGFKRLPGAYYAELPAPSCMVRKNGHGGVNHKLCMALTHKQIDAAYRKVWSTVPHAQRLSAFALEIEAEVREDYEALTDTEMSELYDSLRFAGEGGEINAIEFARAVERAHGITKKGGQYEPK